MKTTFEMQLDNLNAIDFSKKVLRRKTISITDDDENQLNLIRRYMKKDDSKESFNFIVSRDGTSALKRLFDLGEEIDLFIIDINIPFSDGFKVASVIRSFLPYSTPIIFISSSKKNLSEFSIRPMENSYFLQKPIKQEELIKIVESLSRSA